MLLALLTCQLATATQPQKRDTAAIKELFNPTTETVTLNPSGTDSLEVVAYLQAVNRWLTTCGGEGKTLYDRGKAIGLNVSDVFKGLPLPTTKEGLTAWVGEATKIFDSILSAFAVGSPLAMLLTWLLSLVKKNPADTVNKIRLIANRIRTRFFIFGSSLVITVIAAIHFNDGEFGLKDLLTSLATFFGVTIGQMGFQNFLSMLGIRWFEAKKV